MFVFGCVAFVWVLFELRFAPSPSPLPPRPAVGLGQAQALSVDGRMFSATFPHFKGICFLMFFVQGVGWGRREL